jgi:hypothetical protein
MHYPIIPNIISPGIYLDIGFGIDWLKIFTDAYFDMEKEEIRQLFDTFSVTYDFRLYNLIKINTFDINVFTGYNLTLSHFSSIMHNPIIGVSMSVKFIGIEYGYSIPIKYSNYKTFHHIAIVFSVRNNR